jgi:hypothetical protein
MMSKHEDSVVLCARGHHFFVLSRNSDALNTPTMLYILCAKHLIFLYRNTRQTFGKMKPTIAALLGVIAMACASDYSNQTTRRQKQLPPSVSDDVVKKFKERNQVKRDAELTIQRISKGLPFVIDDQEISFADDALDVIKVFTPGAEVVVDGVSQTPVSRVFTSKKDPNILIVKDTNGKLVSATKTNKSTGKSTEVNLIAKGGNAYGTVTSDDLDDKKLALFRLEAVMPPDGTRLLRGLQVRDFVGASDHLANDVDHRSLQEGCDSFNVIEVALVVDSFLCAYAGGSSDVNALSQSIIATASQLYEVPGLCKKLEISSMEIHCNPDTDPIRPLLIQAGTSSVCAESNGLLRTFAGYIGSTGINADVVHLFHGKDFTGTNTVGCAYIGTLCDTYGFNAGVNEISYSGSLSLQSKLVAHENGHICSANHVSDSTDVMYGTICGSCNNAFGQTSKNSINNKDASTSCTSVVGSGDPIPSPTLSPVGSPIAAPTPAPTPNSSTCKDDPLFLFQDKGSLVDCNYLIGLSYGYAKKLCRNSSIGNACRETCGNCP